MFTALRRTSAALLLGAASLGAQAYSGNTTGGATFNRQVSDCSGLSGVGTAVRYSVQAFYVTTSGSYTLSGSSTGTLWDTFVHLYTGSFNPAASATNCTTGNDDGPGGIGTHAFSFSALINTQYFLVTSGFDNDDFGAFTNRFGGPANVTFGTLPSGVVPEPSTYALMATGLIGIAGAARRRRQS
jgi:hypothetical protein